MLQFISSLFLFNKMMLTFTKLNVRHRLQLTIVASDNECCCHFNILTECSEITFQILECHAEILSEQFLNSISATQSAEITTVAV